jgi:hypothetical protein
MEYAPYMDTEDFQPIFEEIGEVRQRVEDGPLVVVRIVQHTENWPGPAVEIEINSEQAWFDPDQAALLADRLPELLRQAETKLRALRS